MYVTTYHSHSPDLENGTYTLLRSSQGNDEIYKANKNRTGKDIEADLILFWLQVTPSEKGCRVQLIHELNLKGSMINKQRRSV